MVEIIPSILSPDVADAQEKLDLCEGKVSSVHLDVMDGSFVDNTTFALSEVPNLRTSCIMRAHLMVLDPISSARQLVGLVNTVFVHYEAVEDFMGTLEVLNEHFHVGVVLNTDTPASVLFGYLDNIDSVILMTVPTGFGGGKFDSKPLAKSLKLKSLKQDLAIGVDGGVHVSTVSEIMKYPIDFVIAGSELFGEKPFDEALETLQKAFDEF